MTLACPTSQAHNPTNVVSLLCMQAQTKRPAGMAVQALQQPRPLPPQQPSPVFRCYVSYTFKHACNLTIAAHNLYLNPVAHGCLTICHSPILPLPALLHACLTKATPDLLLDQHNPKQAPQCMTPRPASKRCSSFMSGIWPLA